MWPFEAMLTWHTTAPALPELWSSGGDGWCSSGSFLSRSNSSSSTETPSENSGIIALSDATTGSAHHSAASVYDLIAALHWTAARQYERP